MNIFMPDNPKVVVLVDANGQPVKVAHNISNNIQVVMANANCFETQAAGLPFSTVIQNPE